MAEHMKQADMYTLCHDVLVGLCSIFLLALREVICKFWGERGLVNCFLLHNIPHVSRKRGKKNQLFQMNIYNMDCKHV